MRWWSPFDWKGCTRTTLAASWYANMMYWLPLIPRIGNGSRLLVYNVDISNSQMSTVSVGAVSSSNSWVDGRMLSHALVVSSAFAAVAHLVERSPCRTCVKCPRIVGVALVGKYLATLSTIRPGNDRKFPHLTARRREDLTGDPIVQCRYSMRFFVDGKSYALQWYSVERVGGMPVGDQVVGGARVGAIGVGNSTGGGTGVCTIGCSAGCISSSSPEGIMCGSCGRWTWLGLDCVVV
jgi:hypothetical protein